MDIGLAFFVYIRPKHTEKVIASIKKNKFKKIYIFQDGLKREDDRKSWEEVSTIIKSVNKIKDCDVEINISETNKGLANSIVYGIEYVLKRHEAVIALEDDVILGKDFYRYADACFEKYLEDTRVMSICGAGVNDLVVADKNYMSNYKYDIYFTNTGTSVAFGTWRNRWSKYRRDAEYAMSVLNDPSQVKKIRLLGGNYLLEMLKCSIEHPQKIDTWATYWGVMLLSMEGIAVVPIKALACDIGRDGTGTNSKEKTTQFETMLSDLDRKIVLPSEDDIKVDQYLRARQNIVIENGNKYKCWIKLKLLELKRRFVNDRYQ